MAAGGPEKRAAWIALGSPVVAADPAPAASVSPRCPRRDFGSAFKTLCSREFAPTTSATLAHLDRVEAAAPQAGSGAPRSRRHTPERMHARGTPAPSRTRCEESIGGKRPEDRVAIAAVGEHVDDHVRSPSRNERGDGGGSPPSAGRDQQQHRRAPRKERVQPDDHWMPPNGSPESEIGEGARPTFRPRRQRKRRSTEGRAGSPRRLAAIPTAGVGTDTRPRTRGPVAVCTLTDDGLAEASGPEGTPGEKPPL
jgi:hypothetical protein